MNPDNTKISDCHNFVTDSTNPNEVRCCCCGQVCTWHLAEAKKEEPAVPVLANPISETTKTTTPEEKTPVEPPQSQDDVTECDFEPEFKREFELYKVWRTMPPLARNQSDETLLNIGLEDWMIDIMKIKTQVEFGQKYNIHENTMTKWNKQIDREEFGDRFGWARHLSKNMIMALYRSALKKGSADQIKAWFQIIEDWVPKTETKIEDNRETTKLRKKLYSIMEEWTDDDEDTDQGRSDGGAS